MCIYLFCILVNHFRLFMLHFAHAHVYARTLTHTHTRPQLQLLQAISNMRFCLHSYVCMQVCVVVCRTRPTFCIFLFWYRFQNKTTHFPRCKRNSDSDSDFSSFSSLFLTVVLFAGFLFAPQLHNICSAHFVYTILFIYFTASSEFYFAPRARTDTHSIPHSHTHMHTNSLTHSPKLAFACMYV